MARVFGEETRWPTRRDRVLWVATCRRPSDWSVRVVAVRVRAGPAGWAGGRVLWTPLVVETNLAIEINVDTSMPNEQPSKCSRIQSEEIDRDLGSCKQICKFPIKKQDESEKLISKKVHINQKI